MNPSTTPTAPPAPKPNSFTKHNTVDAANAGARLYLLDPTGALTEDWLHVFGTDSTAFQIAQRNMRRGIFAFVEAKGEQVKETNDYAVKTMDEQRKLQASLISAWSFDEPCTPENVCALFAQAPYVAEQVDEFASKRARFVKA